MSNSDNQPISDRPNKPDFREPRTRITKPVSQTTTTTTTTTTSSSSSSGSFSGRVNLNPVSNGHSGELLGSNGPGLTRPGHRRVGSTGSHSVVYSGWAVGESVNSPSANVLPTGNIICPSGRIKGGQTHYRNNETAHLGQQLNARNSPRKPDVLGSGRVNYGHGSIIRAGGAAPKSEISVKGNVDAEEVKRIGNEEYKRGNFSEALCLYDKAIAISPGNAAYRSNRAAALTGLGRVVEAVMECEEAVRLDPAYGRAHHRLGSLLIR